MAGSLRGGVVVHDIAWMRLVLWRELLAGLFDHPLLQPELREHPRPAYRHRPPGERHPAHPRGAVHGLAGGDARLAGGEAPGSSRRTASTGACCGPASGRSLEFRPVSATDGRPLRTAGSLVRAEVEAGRARSALRVRVTRQSDHLLGTADWNGAQVARRAARLEAFDEMPFLAEALDRTGHDRVFERALDRAVKLTAGLVPGRRADHMSDPKPATLPAGQHPDASPRTAARARRDRT